MDIKLPVKYNSEAWVIQDVDGNIILDVRGWGLLQDEQRHNEFGNYLANLINGDWEVSLTKREKIIDLFFKLVEHQIYQPGLDCRMLLKRPNNPHRAKFHWTGMIAWELELKELEVNLTLKLEGWLIGTKIHTPKASEIRMFKKIQALEKQIKMK